MAVLPLPPLAIDADPATQLPAYSGAAFRTALGGLLATTSASATGTRSGALDTRAFKASLSGQTVTVATGGFVVGTSAGPYLMGLDQPLQAGTVAPADPTNARIDRVIVRVDDPANGGTSDRAAAVLVVTGTPSAVPSAPSVSGASGWAELARVNVPRQGGGAPSLTDTRTFSTTAGGVLPFATQSQISAHTPPPGTLAFCIEDNSLQMRAASKWARLIVAEDTGWMSFGSLPSGWAARESFQYRVRNGILYLRGALANSSFSGGWLTVGVLPVGARPQYTVGASIQGNTAVGQSAQITSAGLVQVYSTAQTGAWYMISGLPPAVVS